MKKLLREVVFPVALAALAVWWIGCGAARPPAPWPTPQVLAMWQGTCAAVWQEELGRAIDPPALQGCIADAKAGGTADTIRANVQKSAEYIERQKRLHPPIPPPTRVRVDGRFFVNDAGTFRPKFASYLASLGPNAPPMSAGLEEYRQLGFNGIRVFAGDLPWAGQTASQARGQLPTLLTEAEKRGLYVYVTAVTGAASGFDVEAHLRSVATTCAAHPNCLLEAANEIGHPTQSSTVNTIPTFLSIARRSIPVGVVWALGSPLGRDEMDPQGHYPTDGGLFNDSHLDRGRDDFNQVRRIREIAGISEATRKPAMSGEPIGANEIRQPGRRNNDPEFFYTMGVLCRGFEVGCVFHSEDGLNARPLGPVQKQCAEAFIKGWNAIPTQARLEYQNAGHANSPVDKADFTKVVRAYSFITGPEGWTVLVGETGDPAIQWKNGWHPEDTAADWAHVKVVHVRR